MGAERALKGTYPGKVAIKRAIEAGRDCGIDVSGFEVRPDGTIRILSEKVSRVDNAYDRWKAGRRKE